MTLVNGGLGGVIPGLGDGYFKALRSGRTGMYAPHPCTSSFEEFHVYDAVSLDRIRYVLTRPVLVIWVTGPCEIKTENTT